MKQIHLRTLAAAVDALEGNQLAKRAFVDLFSHIRLCEVPTRREGLPPSSLTAVLRPCNAAHATAVPAQCTIEDLQGFRNAVLLRNERRLTVMWHSERSEESRLDCNSILLDENDATVRRSTISNSLLFSRSPSPVNCRL